MDSSMYKVFLLLHISSVVVAFGANFVQPMLVRAGEVTNETLRRSTLFIQLPGLVAVWVTGMGLAGMSDDVFELTQTWLALAIVVFLAGVALLYLTSRAYRDDDTRLVPMYNGVLHLLLVIALYLMIWKPGF
jgi:uncharacterized membrane protein